jgi:hypothetical protein
MLEVGVIRRLERAEVPAGAVRLFAVDEIHKMRRRPIKWPREINEAFGRETLEGLTVVSRTQVRRGIFDGPIAICIDFRQFFDQIPLASEIQTRYCFRDSKGRHFCLTRLPMGLRHATEVATAVTRRLVDFPHAGVTVDYAADNVRLIGAREAVLAAFSTLLARCQAVGVQINEDTSSPAALLATEYDFLGERFNHVTTTMCSTEKTHTKLEATWRRRDAWTYRQCFTHFGVLMYASSTLRLPLADYFHALRYFRRAACMLQAHPDRWDTPAEPLDPTPSAELATWTLRALANVPVPIPRPDQAEATALIAVDASGWGWGAARIDLASGLTSIHHMAWTPQDGLVGAGSVRTEPEGIWRAALHFLRPGSRGNVVILTDHQPVVPALARGYAKAWTYNQLLQRLTSSFPGTTFEFRHIAGTDNPLDAASRGLASGPGIPEAMMGLMGAPNLAVFEKPFAHPFAEIGKQAGKPSGNVPAEPAP